MTIVRVNDIKNRLSDPNYCASSKQDLWFGILWFLEDPRDVDERISGCKIELKENLIERTQQTATGPLLGQIRLNEEAGEVVFTDFVDADGGVKHTIKIIDINAELALHFRSDRQYEGLDEKTSDALNTALVPAYAALHNQWALSIFKIGGLFNNFLEDPHKIDEFYQPREAEAASKL